MMQEKTMTTHTQARGDASAFYSLRQLLLCVIAPSPTRFTPYILCSSHLPHLHLPLYRPLTPSLPLYFLSFSLPPFSLSSCLPSSLSSSLLASIHPSIPPSPSTAAAGLRCSWADITRGLPCFSRHCPPQMMVFQLQSCPSPRLGQPRPISLPPNPQWQHVFPRCCWLSLCVR